MFSNEISFFSGIFECLPPLLRYAIFLPFVLTATISILRRVMG